jgi:hypothetical protein
MQDRVVAAAVIAADPHGVGAAYDRYAASVVYKPKPQPTPSA